MILERTCSPWSVLSRQGTGEKLARIESLGDTRLSGGGFSTSQMHKHTGTTWGSTQSHTLHTPEITTEIPTTVPEGMGQFSHFVLPTSLHSVHTFCGLTAEATGTAAGIWGQDFALTRENF